MSKEKTERVSHNNIGIRESTTDKRNISGFIAACRNFIAGEFFVQANTFASR